MKGSVHQHGEDLHAGDRSSRRDIEAKVEKLMMMDTTKEEEIWLESRHQDVDEDLLVDVGDAASIFYDDFPPLPDFPCMSSSSSSSSTQAPVKAIACSSSAASTASSSSSAASWALLKSDADEATHGYHHASHDLVEEYHGTTGAAAAAAAALSSTASMEIPQQPQQQDDDHHHDVMEGVDDCIDVMENFGYMDLLDNNDLFDPCSIFQHDDIGGLVKPEQEQERSRTLEQEVPSMVYEEEVKKNINNNNNHDQEGKASASDDLAMVFLEWLKSNKETVSAEDLRSVKIKKATIECAARRLGGGKEGMKQLLKLILEWVQTNHLQKRRIKDSNNNNNNIIDLPPPYHYHQHQVQVQDSFQNPKPNPNLNCNIQVPPPPPPPEPQACFPQPAWIAPPPPPPPAYVADPAVMPGFAPGIGYMGDPFSSGAAPNVNSHPYHPPTTTDYQMLDSAQTWPPSQFAMAQYNTFPDTTSNLHPPQPPVVAPAPAPPQPSGYPSGYGNQYPPPYQYIQGHSNNNDQRLVRLGSSATKEARKKRMARQRRFAPHHRHHNHHNNQQSHTSVDQHARLMNDNCMAQAGNWVFWPAVAGGVASNPPPVMPGDVALDRTGMQGQPYQRQVASDRRQGWKPEKNLRFLLQKVLKQSDVGNLGRIVLPKKEAETHLPELEARDGISIAMEDIGTSRVWNMRYRFWPNNKSRMYLLENTGDFVRTNGLQEGDFIVIYSDIKCGKYLIRGVKVRQSGQKSEAKRPGKSQKNHHSNSPSSAAAAANGSSSAPNKQTVK